MTQPSHANSPSTATVTCPGDLFIVSAPSGAGKTTLIRNVIDSAIGGGLHFAVSHTTRLPRPNEVDGRDYHFVAASEFDRMVSEGRFLEWATVHGNRYGTSWAEVEPKLRQGLDVLLDIDVQGAARIAARDGRGLPAGTAVHTIFILPPSFRALRERLMRRGGAGPGDLERRLEEAHREIAQVDRYQYVIVNHEAGSATRVLSSIIMDKRHRRARMAGVVQELRLDLSEESSAAEGASGRSEAGE
jgi:guanylate kinase